MNFWTKGFSLLSLLLPILLSACGGGNNGQPDGRIDGGDDGSLEDAADAGGDTDGSGVGDSDGGDTGPVVVVVQAVLPSRGPVEGGTWTNIVGSGFVHGIAANAYDVRDVTDVTFGDNSAIDIEVVRDDMISVRTPTGLAGKVAVTVKNPNGSASLPQAFTYFETVAAFQVDPKEFSAAGGTALAVDGTGYSPDTTVLVGGREASQVTVESTTRVRALAPPGIPGPADVDVVNRNGHATLFRAVRYHPLPQLSAIDPAAGPPAGGTAVVASAGGLEDGLNLLFGTSPATGVTLQAPDRLGATTPAGAPGPVDVTLSGPTDSAVLPAGFFYLPPLSGALSVLGVAPGTGPDSGGQSVTVIGEGFAAGVDEVLFGTTGASQLTPIDDRTLRVLTPTGSAGKVQVSVREGASQASLADAYRYFTPPKLIQLDPNHGPMSGGTTITLTGSGFHPGMEVLLGGTPAAQVQVASDTLLSGSTPAGSPGAVDVLARDADSQSVLPAAFTYESGLSLLRVDPDNGAVAGGTYVLCYGSGFGPGTRLWFGAQEGTVVQVLSSSVLAARTPRGDPGEVDVKVERASEDFELPGGFSYVDPTNDRGGASGGPIHGSVNVTVLDGSWNKFGAPLPGATVIIEEPAVSGTTDDRGQITFSGPAIVRALTLTIGKPNYEAITVSDLNASNLTVYLYPNQQEPISVQPGQYKTGGFSGRVFGFKDIPGLPSGPTVSMQARVNFTSWSIYSVPPYGGTPKGDIIDHDGGGFNYPTLLFGTYSLYSLFGAYDSASDVFTPALLGLRRQIQIDSEDPLTGQDIVLSTYLDQSAAVHLVNPPLAPAGQQATYGAYVSLDLGRDGVIFLAQDTGDGTELVLDHLPSAASTSFLFVGLANVGNSYPYSYTFRRQDGGLANGVQLGPFLGFTQIQDPPKDGVLTNGHIAWSSPQDPPPALTVLEIETNDLMPTVLWRVVLPGDATEVTLPAELLPLLPQGEPLLLLLFTADSPRFDFDRFNYSQLSSGVWTNYTINFTTFTAP